ncbi:MAG: ATP-binding cassette domain-containing protein [Flavobacteriales bacterium]|nr:ATP-binding cassette domain-containing protein [Flavobacteriales bacterium]
MIEIKNISKKFSDRQVLYDFNATFEEGMCNLIIGQSGSGKTVLMKCLVGLLEPTTGGVYYAGTDFTKASEKERKRIRQEIGMVFQGGALFDSMTCEENVAFPLRMFTNWNKAKIADRVKFCLDRVNLSHAYQLYPAELSGGMRKRVAIARAIALNPKYLFFDEPNSGLDPQTGIVIDRLIKEITQEFKTTTIINTHDMNSVVEIGDKVIFIYKGHKHWEGDGTNIVNSNNKELIEFVFATGLLKRVQNTF